jgi:hypothetical protein
VPMEACWCFMYMHSDLLTNLHIDATCFVIGNEQVVREIKFMTI